MTETEEEYTPNADEVPLDEPPEEEGDNSKVTEFRGDEENGEEA